MQIPLLFLCKVQDVELSLQFCLQEVPILSVTGEQRTLLHPWMYFCSKCTFPMLGIWICSKTVLKRNALHKPAPQDPTGSICVHHFIPIKTPKPWYWEEKSHSALNNQEARGGKERKYGKRGEKCIKAGRKIHLGQLEKAIIISLTSSWVSVCSEPAWVVFQREW